MGRAGTISERNKVQDRRQKLLARIHAFHSEADTYYAFLDKDLEDDAVAQPDVDDPDDDDDVDDPFVDNNSNDKADDEEIPQQTVHPEKLKIRMPSSIFASVPHKPRAFLRLAEQEKQLRVGEANEAIQNLRLDIGHKSLLFSTKIREARGTHSRTRAWDNIHGVNYKVKVHAADYRLARASLVMLASSEDILTKYRTLINTDLRLPGDITDPNRFNQRSDTLPWIWKLVEPGDEVHNNWMQESEYQSCRPTSAFRLNQTPYSLSSYVASCKGSAGSMARRVGHCRVRDGLHNPLVSTPKAPVGYTSGGSS